MENEVMELEQKAVAIDVQAREITIANQEQYNRAQDFLKTIKNMQAQVKDTFRPIIDQAYKTHKEAVAKEKFHLEPLIKAYDSVNLKMIAFYREQERIRLEMERKLQAEAEKKRQEALAKAEAARAEGKEIKAEKFEAKAAAVVAPQLAPTFDKGGAIIKKLYHAEVVDLMALIKSVASGQAPISLVEANMTVLNAQARALKETMSYPGVKVVSEDNLSTRSR